MKNVILVLLLCQVAVAGCKTGVVAPAKSGTVTETAASYFTNPVAEGADPWVIKKDGYYYFCSSNEGAIYVSRSEKLTDRGVPVKVWQSPDSGWNKSNVWAPELHYYKDRWYVYYAAAKKAGAPFVFQRAGVLESNGEDVFGPYHDKGMLYTGDSIQHSASAVWAIDLTTFKTNGQLYAIWSGWEANAETDKTAQHLYIARMSTPSTISSNRVKISSPTEPWETGGTLDLNEGPEVLRHQQKLFVIYSTRESWMPAYRLGQLTLADTLLNPMLPQNWVKTGPVFQGTGNVYGVGHASFTTSPDGTENWILYHSKKNTNPGWDRDIRLQKFTWNADGSPDFGEPQPPGERIKKPSGEN